MRKRMRRMRMRKMMRMLSVTERADDQRPQEAAGRRRGGRRARGSVADDGRVFAEGLRAFPLAPSPALPVTPLALLLRARLSCFNYHVFILKIKK